RLRGGWLQGPYKCSAGEKLDEFPPPHGLPSGRGFHTLAHQGGEVFVQYSKISDPMSALGHKRTFMEVCMMSALPSKADIRTWPSYVWRRQLRQLGDVCSDPSRLVAGEQLGGRAPARLSRRTMLERLLPFCYPIR